MLACDQPRQHNHYRFHDRLPSPPPSNRNLQQTFFNRLAQSATTPSSSASNDRLPSHYFDPATAFESSPYSQQSLENQYMSGDFNFQSPAIRVQQSTPTPGLQLLAGHPQPQPQQQQQQQQLLPSDSNAYTQAWDSIGAEPFGSSGHMVATQSLRTPGLTRARPHQRAPSASSIGSSGSASPYSQGHASAYSYAVSDGSPTVSTASKLGHNYNVDQSSRPFSNHLPTPTQTPTHDTFLAASYPNYSQQGTLDSAVAAHLAMNQVIEHDTTANNDEELPGMSHSARQSISDMGQEPSTPRTVAGDIYDDHYKQPDAIPRQTVPKFDRTMSDIYQDELYNPAVPQLQTQTATRSTPAKQWLSPHRNVITERLHAAEIARSQSPTVAISRGVSPFRPDSPYVQDPYMQASRFHTASQVRQRQKQQADVKELSQHQPKAQRASTPKTISPKDALLEYKESEEDSKTPLFAETSPAGYGQQYGGAQQPFSTSTHGQFETAPQPFGNIASSSRAENWTNPRRQGASAFSTTPAAAQQQSAFNFSPNATAGNLGALPFSSQNYRPAAAPVAMPPTKQEETPDFPAHLTSMESSASEAPPSSNNSTGSKTQKPASSLADTGTYTCTYHGCTLRFETPQKLQKHKREGHRNPAASPSSPTVSASAMTSADILARNSQAGPHKCERINPTTGKSCNTVFSRPYDLTRHEDTIHNVRKQKVRCALCVEEKTFSRNDALTRHMRVVHPEVDFPGKHRKRGANDS